MAETTAPSPKDSAGGSFKLAESPAPPRHESWRIFLFFSCAFVLTGLVSMLFADLLWRSGWSTSRTVLLSLFVVLFFFAAVGCMHGVFGFIMRRTRDRLRITRMADYKSQRIDETSTAIIFPIYNEDVARVYEGLRATYESMEKTGELPRFDFFILSDSTDPDKWVEEEKLWYEVVRELGALGRIYYRRREQNEGRKSGNVRDFLNTWGRRYNYFIVFDADSVMRGPTLVDLVKLMQANPGVGLIQTVPALVNAESLFGRIQQFANRLYAPLFTAGLNYWSQGLGNYWGHNAIIRTEPFMQYCDLPHLPGRRPFGGQILSHDFVEAALLLRANWQVWLAYDLDGSYEEAPQSLVENAQRDRRWCQGNLQHGLVLFARGLRGVSRVHLIQGICGYLSGPLWFCFLITFNWMWGAHKASGLSEITVRGWTPYLNLTPSGHAFLVFSICMAVLLLPKLLALIDLALSGESRRSFGGLLRASAGTIAETGFSVLHAPLQMLWHLQFVVTILAGVTVQWGNQNRGANGTLWSAAFRRLWVHSVVGLLWGAMVWYLDPTTFWWFAPVCAGLLFSIPLSVLTSRSTAGARARNWGLFLTPEETNPPAELVTLRVRMATVAGAEEAKPRHPQAGVTESVLDPYVNALHVSLLREKRLSSFPASQDAAIEPAGGGVPTRELGAKLLADGPESLAPKERLRVMSDPEVMAWLHRQAWLRPADKLAAWWRAAIRRFAR